MNDTTDTRAQVAAGDSATTVHTTTATAQELRLLIERAERLEEEKKGIAEDIKDTFAEAKARGFDTTAMKKIMRIRKQKKEDFEHEEAILETYMAALGMI